MISIVELVNVALLISISSFDDEHYDDIVRVPSQSMRGVEIVSPSSGNSDIMKLRNLKKATPIANLTIVMALPIPQKFIDPIAELSWRQ